MISAIVAGCVLPGADSSAAKSPALNRFNDALNVANRTGASAKAFWAYCHAFL